MRWEISTECFVDQSVSETRSTDQACWWSIEYFRIVRTKTEKVSNIKMNPHDFDNKGDTRTSDGHSPTNSSDDIHSTNYPSVTVYQTTGSATSSTSSSSTSGTTGQSTNTIGTNHSNLTNNNNGPLNTSSSTFNETNWGSNNIVEDIYIKESGESGSNNAQKLFTLLLCSVFSRRSNIDHGFWRQSCYFRQFLSWKSVRRFHSIRWNSTANTTRRANHSSKSKTFRIVSAINIFSIFQQYFESARNHWQNSASYYPTSSSDMCSLETTSNTNLHSTNGLPIIVDSSLSISPTSLLSFEQISLLQHQRGSEKYFYFWKITRSSVFFFFDRSWLFLDERLNKDLSVDSLIMKDLQCSSGSTLLPLPMPSASTSVHALSNRSVSILNYPRIYSSTSSSPMSLNNDNETTIHYDRSSPLTSMQHQPTSVNISLPSYADLTPVIHSTPLPSFETLNRRS